MFSVAFKQVKFTGIAALVAAATATIGSGAHAQGLPDGQGKDIVQNACTQCHAADVITRQPRSGDEWTEVVARMIGSGAQLSDDDYTVVIQYLSTHIGPNSQNAPAKGPPAAKAPGSQNAK